ncbi:MAG: chemotaxis-specific protein-glutamate methyltransferase CheB [Treponema sp.]|nr:chemotaxis-specific protein-glutamate methyltransferase CheB [Treponema sp.]
MDDIRVAICDDSALMRNLIGRIIEENEGLKIAGKAVNGQDLLDRMAEFRPDVILLDIEMPVMNGVKFLEERKARRIDVPVIILSSVATEGASVTMQCLSLGASDFITKPGGSVTLKISDVSEHIVECVSAYGGAYASMHHKNVHEPDFFHNQIKYRAAEKFVQQKKIEQGVQNVTIKKEEVKSSFWQQPSKPKEKQTITPVRDGGRIEVIVLGISTGGPNALREMFKELSPDLKQPILVVQHMPAGFTTEFARSLNSICPLEVSEAVDGEPIFGGHIYIAPGSHHIYIEKRAIGNVIRLSDAPQRNGHRPSADVLFESAAKVYQNHALGIIMTGMGKDGAAQLAEMRKEGAWTLGQDEKSSIVYGMPRVAWEMGAVQKQVALADMAREVNNLAAEHYMR